MKKILIYTVLSAIAAMSAQAQTMPKLSEDGVDLFVGMQYCTRWDNSDVFPGDSAGIYRIPTGDSELRCVKAPIAVNGGIAYHDGKVYMNVFDDENTSADQITPVWQVIDLATGKVEKSITGETGSGITTTITYDPTEDVIYGVVSANDSRRFYLAKIDPETGEKTNVGWLTEERTGSHLSKCPALACDKYGTLYAIYTRYPESEEVMRFGQIQKDGTVLQIGEGNGISCSGMLDGDYMSIYRPIRQALFYNTKSDKLYWIHCGVSAYMDAYYTPIFEMNYNSGGATMVGYLPQGYHLTGAFFNEPELTSPDGVDDFEYVYSASSADRTTGRLSMKAPSATYGGDPINGTLTIVINEGDTEVFRIPGVTPGQTVTTDEQDFPYGEHTYTVKAVMADGTEGVSRDINVYVGYDIPINPTDVTLTLEGNSLKLTWTPPTTGTHGLEIDPDGITYRIRRITSPLQTTEIVKDDVAGNSCVTGEPGSELKRYQYYVYSKYGDKVGYGMISNAVIAGDPLNAPYTIEFTSPNAEDEMWNKFKVTDVNGDGYSWMYYGGMAMYVYNTTEDADDWLFTPPINYIAGHRYRLAFGAMSSLTDYLERLEVTFGNDDTPEAQELLENGRIEVPVSDDGTDYEFTVTVEESGVCFFGLHAISPKNYQFLGVTYIEVIDLDAQAGVGNIELANESLVITAGNGSLSVTNPTGNTTTIYAINGTTVYSSDAVAFTTQLPAGIYIVKCGTEVRKVMVK